MGKRTFYHTPREEQTLWDNIKRGLEQTYRIDGPSNGYVLEVKIFMPYVVFIDEEKSEIALANRDYKPLGMLCDWIDDRPFRWMKVDLSQLPEMNPLKDEVVNGRNAKCKSLYFRETPYDGDKEAFDTYLMKLAQLEKACSENFIMPRIIIAMRDLYRLKFRDLKLVDECKWANRTLSKQARKIASLNNEIYDLKKQIEELQGK